MQKAHLTGIIMATSLEAMPFFEGLSLKRKENVPFPTYYNDNCVLIISGIGKINAAMATTFCHLRFNPLSIYNLGAAGALDYSHSLGGIYNISKVIEFDRRNIRSGNPQVHIPCILEGFSTATIATLDSPVRDPEKRSEISFYADLIDMESASVVHVCKRFRTKCYIFKFVSDTPEHKCHDAIVKNIMQYRTLLFELFSNTILPNHINHLATT